LNINSAGSGEISSAIGTGTFTISGGTIDNSSSDSLHLSTNNSLNITANFTFTGTKSLNLGTGVVTLPSSASATITTSTAGKTLVIGGTINQSGSSLVKAGPGILKLDASAETLNNVTINNLTISDGELFSTPGTLSIGGTLSSTTERFNANGGTVNFDGADQAVPVLGYNNLIFSGSGAKTFGSGTLDTQGKLTIRSGVTTYVANGLAYNVGDLVLGLGPQSQSAGVYGGSSAPNTYKVGPRTITVSKNSTFFGSTFDGVIISRAAALPVTLSSFTAKLTTDNKVALAWITSSESVNKGFSIERQEEGSGKFQYLGFIASKAVGGNSQTTLAYSFKDVTAKKGTNMYRLVQEDLDGKLTYSEVRVVKLNGQSVSMVFPNPSTGVVNISRTADGKKMNIQVIDQSGRIVSQVSNIIDANYRMNLPQSGIYNIKLMYPETGEQSIQRIVVQK